MIPLAAASLSDRCGANVVPDRGTAKLSGVKGLTRANAAWQHSAIESPESFSERTMRIDAYNQPTKRPALGSCSTHGADRLAVMVWSLSGRAAE